MIDVVLRENEASRPRTGAAALAAMLGALAAAWLAPAGPAGRVGAALPFLVMAVLARRRPMLAAALAAVGVLAGATTEGAAPAWFVAAAWVVGAAFPFHLVHEGLRREVDDVVMELLVLGQPGVAWMHRVIEADPELGEGPAAQLLLRIFVVSAVVQAGLSLVRRSPGRAVGSIAFAQTSLILAGTCSGEVGWSAARALVLSAALGSAVLLAVVGDLERNRRLGLDHDHGLAAVAPDHHWIFALAGWLFVGMPGGIAFFAEDLLFHAILERSPVGTMFFVVAMGLGVVGFFRVYVALFAGPPDRHEAPRRMDPARRRVLVLLLALLVLGGLTPGATT